MYNDRRDRFPVMRREEFIPRDVNPLSFRTGLRFAANMWAALRFTGGVFALLASVLCGCAALMWVAEDGWTFAESLYLVAITALTIGYGDITPATHLGKCLSVFSGLVGILFTGIVIAVAVEALRYTIREEFELPHVDPTNGELGEHHTGERGT